MDGKFYQSSEFFDYIDSDNDSDSEYIQITQQGLNLIEKLKRNVNNNYQRNIGIVRLAGNFCKGVSKYNMIKENQLDIEDALDITLDFVGHSDKSIPWDDDRYWRNKIPHNRPYLIIINQMAGRSTVWRCHPYLAWFHTHRSDRTALATIVQDQERPVYYAANNTIYNIEIYGDKLAAHFSAGEINLMGYEYHTNRKLDLRLKKKNTKKITVVYVIYEQWDWENIQQEKIPRKCYSMVMKYIKNKENIETHITDMKKDSYGFYMTNIRSSIRYYLEGKLPTSVFRRPQIIREIKEGINKDSKIRVNVFYEMGETDPSKYKFILRMFDGYENGGYVNKSMYQQRDGNV